MHKAGLTVLVVEDEPIIRFTLADALEDAGYSVLEASSVLEAVAIIGKTDNIAAIITDIDMPGGLSGLDLVRMLEKSQEHMPFIVTSGGHALEMLDLPTDVRFFSKPYHLDDILFALHASIASKAKAGKNRRGYRLAGMTIR